MRRLQALSLGFMLAASPLAIATGVAQSLDAALSSAYRANPDLNATRASLRATDEGVPTAMSAYRPRVTGTADYGYNSTDARSPGRQTNTELNPHGFGLTVAQTLYNGGRTGNSVRAAESQVLGARETLRNSEQNTLLDAVTAYMNVLRDTALFNLRQNNVTVLAEQVRQTKDRFSVGEVTRTDVAQAEARLAGSRSELALAQSSLRGSVARFKQVIGIDPKSSTRCSRWLPAGCRKHRAMP